MFEKLSPRPSKSEILDHTKIYADRGGVLGIMDVRVEVVLRKSSKIWRDIILIEGANGNIVEQYA